MAGPVAAFEEVTEGSTTILVPRTEHVLGPKKREGGPFYNPAMRTARDISVLVLRRLVHATGRRWTVCDAMTATGARGLRLANEVPEVKVQLNDANPDSIQLAQGNAKRLGLRNVDFRVGRLEPHLGAERYDWVDIDPFGTPAPFIDVAVLAVNDGGVLAVTATDTATLSGVYAGACQRRYNAKPLRGRCMPELAARILVGAIVRAAGRRDRGAKPLLAYATQHYVRAYVRLEGGPTAADEAARLLQYAYFTPDGNRGFSSKPRDDHAGPLWAGPLMEVDVVKRMADDAQAHANLARTTLRLLERWREEADAPGLYFDVEEATQGRAIEAPRMEAWIEALRAQGFAATRTHFSDRGIKTNARLEDLVTTAAKARATPRIP